MWPSLQLKGHKGEIFCISSVSLALLLFYFSSFHGMICADPAVAGGGDSIIYIYILTVGQGIEKIGSQYDP